MNRVNKSESAVFLYCRCSLFLKDPFFQIILRSQQLSLFLCGVCKNSPFIDTVLMHFHILVLWGYWILMENRIPLKLVVLLHYPLFLMNRLNKTWSAVFLYCRERSGSVVECLTRDRGAASSSLIGVTALWSLSKTHLS